ncbi:MAG TPA: hypothetical protein ENJ87_09325 [Gammaproteobacteria bacterium]|nr:hypothetical protein [Gammaproteobacteria bacterium]
MSIVRIKNPYPFILMLCLSITSCASTSITEDWVEEGLNGTYEHPMILAIADSQQTRRIYEKYFVSELKKKNITAIPSYELISSKQKLNRETVVHAIRGTDIDSVLVTYLILADSKIQVSESPIDMGYSGNVENLMMSDTLISVRGRSNSAEIIGLKSDFYDVASKKLVWSVQTQSVAPESIDQVITEVSDLLIGRLYDDGVLKE